jgi:hypothetical protein
LPVVVAVVVAAGGVIALFAYPVSQTAAKNFSVIRPINETFAHAGTYSFGWSTTSGNVTTLSVWGPGGRDGGQEIYIQSNSHGSGKIPVISGQIYTFELTGVHQETVNVAGYLDWTSPAL